MTKSELIERLCAEQTHLSAKEIEDAVKDILEHMASSLEQGDRIEIRGFGSFSLHYREPRIGRNPKLEIRLNLRVNMYLILNLERASRTCEQQPVNHFAYYE